MEGIDFLDEDISWSDWEEGEWTSWPKMTELPLFDPDDGYDYDFSLHNELDSDLLSLGFSDEEYTPSDIPIEGEVESEPSEDWNWPVDDGNQNNTEAEEGKEKETDFESKEPIDLASLSIGEYTEEDMSRCNCLYSGKETISILRLANARIEELREQEEAELRELESKKVKK